MAKAAAPSAATGPSDSAALSAELTQARAEIANLRKQLAQAETTSATLRSRGAGSEKAPVSSGEVGAGASQAVAQQNAAGGIPVQAVLAIAAGVFVFTWCVRVALRHNGSVGTQKLTSLSSRSC